MIDDPQARRAYILGGNAKFTVVSRDTGTSYTYRVRAKRGGGAGGKALHFVEVLTGPDNTRDFTFLGTIFEGDRYIHSKKSPIGASAPSAKAFQWVWDHLDSPRFELLHSGECSRCGRELTDEESIRTGLGPVCREKSMY